MDPMASVEIVIPGVQNSSPESRSDSAVGPPTT